MAIDILNPSFPYHLAHEHAGGGVQHEAAAVQDVGAAHEAGLTQGGQALAQVRHAHDAAGGGAGSHVAAVLAPAAEKGKMKCHG